MHYLIMKCQRRSRMRQRVRERMLGVEKGTASHWWSRKHQNRCSMRYRQTNRQTSRQADIGADRQPATLGSFWAWTAHETVSVWTEEAPSHFLKNDLELTT